MLAIVVVYILITFAIGYWSRRHARTSRSFEGANLGLLLVVVAGAGEWMGGTSTTGVSEYGFTYGLSGAWYTIANGLGVCFLAIFFARMFRRLNKPTVSGIMGEFIGDKARLASSLLLIFIMMAVGTSQMIAIGTLGEKMFGFQPQISILILGIGVLAYTLFGGMMAVGYTNIMHMLVMYLGMIMAVIISLSQNNGVEGLRASLPERYFSMTSIGWPKVISWIIASVLGACTAQAGLQPVLAAKDESTAQKSSFLIALVVAPFGLLTALLGMIAKIQFPELNNAKMALPTLLMSMNPIVGGLVFAAILAAILSTASPIFLACGTLFTRDVYPFFKNSKKDDKSLLLISRITTAACGFVCILFSMLLFNSAMILDIVYFAYSLRASVFVIILLGIYWKKTKQKAAIAGMIASGVMGLIWVLYKRMNGVYPIHPQFSETYIAILAALFVTCVVSISEKKNQA